MKVQFTHEQFTILKGLVNAYEALFLQFSSATIKRQNGAWGKLEWERYEGKITFEFSDASEATSALKNKTNKKREVLK